MFKLTIALLKLFALFVFGLFLAFPISSILGAISFLLTYLPLIWQILWRTGVGLIMLTVIALFLEGLKSETKSKL